MRIIAGIFKGAKIDYPENKSTRPLRDGVRENIFNILSHSNEINFTFKKSNILDLYAGSGSFGLECLSRESKNVFFIEKEKEAIEILKKNIKKFDLKKKVELFLGDTIKILQKKSIFNKKFDLIFCDPPYKDLNTQKLISLIYGSNILNKNGTIVLHRKKDSTDILPSYFKIVDERTYGISRIYFGKF